MAKKIDRKLSYKKGDTVHLDEVIEVLSLIPLEYYHQDDPIDWSISSGNTSGEVVEFLADIKVNIKISCGKLT